LAILKGTYRRCVLRAVMPGRRSAGCRLTRKEENSIMAVPKRRMSRANTRSRRAQWKAEATGLVTVNVAGQQHKVPRRLLKAARLGLINLDRR
jgi:large subunit ribosomal protein L32